MQSQDKLDQQNPSQIAYAASLDELFGLGYGYGQIRRDRIASITLDQVNAGRSEILLRAQLRPRHRLAQLEAFRKVSGV